MAIIYTYPEINQVEGEDLLLISDTSIHKRPTRSVTIDNLAAYIGSVVGVVQNLQSVLTVGNTYVSPDGYGTFTLNNIADNNGNIKYVNTDEGWGYFLNAEEGLFFTDGTGSQTGRTGVGLDTVFIGNGNHIGIIRSANITANRTYELPNASGTLALTSDIPTSSTFVDLTSAQTITGAKTFDGAVVTTDDLTINSLYIGTDDNTIALDGNDALYLQGDSGVNLESGDGVNLIITDIVEVAGTTGLSVGEGTLDFNSLSGSRNYAFPNASGTIALTSDIPAPGPGGSGTTNYTARWTSASTLGIGALYDNGTNVGIGTTSASQKLEVSGNSLVTGTQFIGDTFTKIQQASGNLLLTNQSSSGAIRFLTNNTERVRITSAGNVGIGTTSPTKKLHVDGNTLISAEKYYYVAGGGAGFGSDASGNFKIRQNDADLIFGSGNNVGIGTTSPGSKLHVQGTSFFFDQAIFDDKVGIGTTAPTTKLNVSGNISVSSGSYLSFIDSNLSYNKIGRNTSVGGIQITTGASATMNLLDNGNVGIGTTSPSELLELKPGSGGDSKINMVNSSGVQKALIGYDNGNGGLINLYNEAGTRNVVVRGYGNSYFNGGNFGIGITSPGEKLEVVGNIRTNVGNGSGFMLTGSSASGLVRNNGTGLALRTNSIDKLIIDNTGSVTFSAYTGTNEQGTPTYLLGTDASGNVVKTNTVPGSAAGPYLPLAGGTMTGSIDFGTNNRDISMTDSAGAVTRVMVLNTSNTMYIGPVDTYAGGSIIYGAAAGVSYQRWYTGASERMRITPSGNVGIGTTSPGDKLSIAGSLSTLHAGYTTKALRVTMNSNDTLLSLYARADQSNQQVLLRTNGNSYFNGGNVGIGTTNPLNKLFVSASTAGDYAGFIENTNSTNGYGLVARTAHTGTSAYAFAARAGTSDIFVVRGDGMVGIGTYRPNEKLQVGGNIHIWDREGGTDGALYVTRGSTNTTFAKISSNGISYLNGGNVGIGTTSPQQKLDVIGRVRASYNTSNYYEIGASSAGGFVVGKSGGVETVNIRTYGDSHFNGGNVGIGTTSPVSSLNITTTKTVALDTAAKFLTLGLTVDDLTAGNTAGGGGGIAFRSKNTNAGTQIVFGAIDAIKESANVSDFKGSLRFFTNQNSTGIPLERMRITSAGKVGIGTENPAEKLEVSGTGELSLKINNTQYTRSLTIAQGGGYSHLKTSHSSGVAINYGQGNAGILSLFNNTTQSVKINANGSSYLNGGNVGIGTTSPGAKLSVNGNVKIEGTNSLLFGGSASIPSWAINHNGSDLLIDDQGGNIGSVLFNNDEGVALPRLTTTEINAISLPAQGLMAYNTTLNTICFYNGSSWQKVSHTSM